MCSGGTLTAKYSWLFLEKVLTYDAIFSCFYLSNYALLKVISSQKLHTLIPVLAVTTNKFQKSVVNHVNKNRKLLQFEIKI